MYAQSLARKSRKPSIVALIASVATVSLLVAGCGQSVPAAAEPTPHQGAGGGVMFAP